MTNVTLHIIPDALSSRPSSIRSCDGWIARILELDENDLNTLNAVLEAYRSTDCLRRLIQLVPALMEPGQGLQSRFGKPLDEFLAYAFMLHSVHAFIKTRKEPIGLASWCWQTLEALASEDPERRARLTEWCREFLLLNDAAFAEWHDAMASKAHSAHRPADDATP